MNELKCDFCGEIKKSNKSLSQHRMFCKSNPNMIIRDTSAARNALYSKKENCKYCSNSFIKCGIQNHEKSCPQNPENIRNCEFCGKLTSRGRYCSTKCGITSGNQNRVVSDETGKKISTALTGKKYPNRRPGNNSCKVKFINCVNCDNVFMLRGWTSNHRKTCSNKCKVESSFSTRSYVNGKRKTIPYLNGSTTVMLESTWELYIAKFLDENNIRWIRPKSLSWCDADGKARRYFPDFYLIDYDLYLDPKNPFCMKQDEYKMKAISKSVNIIYGSLDHIKNEINKLL